MITSIIVFLAIIGFMAIAAIPIGWFFFNYQTRSLNIDPNQLEEGTMVYVSEDGKTWYERVFCNFNTGNKKYCCKLKGAENFSYTYEWPFCDIAN